MAIKRLSLKANNAVNQNQVFGKTRLRGTPESVLMSSPTERFLLPSVRGDRRRMLLQQGSRYVK